MAWNPFRMRVEPLVLAVMNPREEGEREQALATLLRRPKRSVPALFELLKSHTYNADRGVEYSKAAMQLLISLAQASPQARALLVPRLRAACANRDEERKYTVHPGAILSALGER